MTVITYLNSPGKRLEESPSPESLGNALETWPAFLELTRTTLQHPHANRSAEPKCLDWTREEEGKSASNKESGTRQTWGRGVIPTRTERGGKTERYEQRNEHKCEVWQEPKSVVNRRMQGGLDGGCRLGSSFPFTLSISGGKYQSKRRKKSLWSYLWPFDERKDGVGRRTDALVRKMRLWNVALRLFLLLSLCPKPASSQGNFPRLENIAAFKPISTSPDRSTCGFPVRSSYCQPASNQTDLLRCSLNFCIQDCPYRSSTPPHAPLLLPAHRGSCVIEDSDTPPEMNSSSMNSSNSSSVVFQSVPGGCLVSPPSQNLGPLGSLTLAVWIKPAASREMVLLEKSSGGRLVFVLMVSERVVTLQYGQQPGHQTPLNISFIITQGRIAIDRWTHLVLQVHDKQASLFLDGLEDDGTPFDTQPLTFRLTDITEDSTMLVGQGTNGSNQFIGRMQDFRLYPDTLTNREVVEVYSSVLPSLHTQSECRCPPSHPRVHPLVERYCIPNAVQDTTNNRVLRLDLNAHPLSYINDQDMGTIWLSKPVTASPSMDETLTVTVDLANGQYQVFYVIIQFGGLLPESVRIQRRSVSTTEPQNRSRSDAVWSDWQYMARNCSVFGLENDGPLLRPDSVNCLQLPREVPYTGGNITFSLLTPEPNLRPGYNDFYSTPALQRMVQATHIRIHLSGQYHTTAAGVNRLHRYYAINEITVSGRCECHGHADHCDISVTPYRCACVPESHTEGHNCQRCAPLYNDKPFRSGDQLQPMNCRPCQCNGHAHSCHYDVTADNQPDEHYRGGGGVCDNCMHNTTGRSCELCREEFFRSERSDPRSFDVCQPCDCHTPGTVNGSMQCDQVGGQCSCKSAVAGRRCAECLPGWFGLQAGSPEGCVRCNCSRLGTARAAGGMEPRCDQETGQCHCKAHVTGLWCERCEFGFWNLSHPAGCQPCSCDPLGSLSAFCEVTVGQCECKDGVGGRACDSCATDSYGLRLNGGSCRPCNCSSQGTLPGTHCDPHTGQCMCKEHVEGRRCDWCRAGYHSLEGRNSLGCLPCVCDMRGAVPGSVCDARSGQCTCQEGLEGAQCNRCAPNYYNSSSLLAENTTTSQACVPCSCDPRGIVEGTVCDSDTGQCVCVSTRHRPDCSSCRPGFYLSEDSVCVECGCHPTGASQRVCDQHTGQCVCADLSVAGRRCDQCRDSYHGFNPGHGRCQPCTCHPVGSVHGSCHPDSGVCVCKVLVTGDQCDVCVAGASHMDPDNHLGCSRAPSQQPAPLGVVLNSSSIRLSWGLPDSPNSHSLNYTLLRDGQPVYTVHSQFPFLPQWFEDTGLSPFTNYSYRLLTANIAGQTASSSVSYQTLSAAPDADQLRLTLVGPPGPTSASFNWSSPPNDTGPVERFVLSSIESSSRESVVHYSGVSTAAVASGLKPFSLYMFTLEVCSTGGCSTAPPLSIFTASAAPQDQPTPQVNATGPHTLQAVWEPPSQPNGVITRYEVYLRGPVEPQNHTSPVPERRVFVTPDSNGTGIASPPENSTTITGLQAFSTYHLRVLSVNVAGSVTSEWTVARTLEGAPEWISPPDVSAVSPSILKVTWNTTEGHGVISRGEVKEYRVNLLSEQTRNPSAPPVISQVLYTTSASSPPGYEVRGLKPYRVYNFTVTACTATGCITSTPSTGRTLPGAPSGLSPPILHPFNDTTMQIYWDPPTQPNGPPPLYQVERTDLSFSDPRDPVVRGTRFPGSAYYRFPNHTLPVNTDFTGVQLSFRTRSPDGLLLAAFSPGNQEEFVALQIQDGRPYFLFDPQDSVVAVGVQGDAGRRYDDGQWHSVLALRHGAVGTIVVDNQYRGQASASSGHSIIGENTGVYIGGVPDHFTLLRPDAADVGLVLRGFAGCLRDVRYKMADNLSEEWRLLDWSTATEKVAAYESWEGCPAQSNEGVHFLGQGYLELNSEVLRGGENFEVSVDFKTDQFNALMLFTYNTLSDDFMLVELEGGILNFTLFSGGIKTELNLFGGFGYCDGEWNQLSVAKQGSVISATLGFWSERESGGDGSVLFDSPVYLGGIPPDLKHPALIGRPRHGLGGCVRALTVSDGSRPAVSVSVDLSAAFRRALRVNLDGCSPSESRFACREKDWVLVYTGRQTKARDYTLQPFTEYLYRVVASGTGGVAAGPWERGRSPATVPSSIPAPSVVPSGSGFSVQVSWAPPTGNIRGVIDRYELRAYDTDGGTAPVKATYLNSGNYTGVLSGLMPNTRYVVTVSACTAVGCVESPRHDGGSWSFITQEEAPQGVFVPEAVGSPSSLYVTWRPPARPNGVITEYHLYHNHRPLYTGNLTHLNITGLDVYSTHVLVLGVCTSVGCTNSSQVTMVTSQLPPGELQPPSITLLDPHSILVEWSRPNQVNGVLQSYSLFLSRDGAEPVLAYNSSSLVEDHVLRNLTPGTAYTVTLMACTGGGCTLSLPSHFRTAESSPEDVPAPYVTPLSPNALNVSWTPPDTPNGIITSYGLWLDGALVFNSSSSQRFFVVEGLTPWSQHTLRLQACTAQGCGKGPLVETHTSEWSPDGPVLLEVSQQSSQSVRVRWTAPPRPNGNLSYTIYYSSTEGDGVLHGGLLAGTWLHVSDLSPYTNYSIWVRACNSQGCVESLPRFVTTLPAAPAGVSPPRLIGSTSTSLNVSWSPPNRTNSPDLLHYSLSMKPEQNHTSDTGPVIIMENVTDRYWYSVEGLSPFSVYLFRLLVSHTHGRTASPWTSLRTAEDSPRSMDAPSVSELHARNVTVSWAPPSQPNGLIDHYNLHLHSMSSSSSSSTATTTAPYSSTRLQLSSGTITPPSAPVSTSGANPSTATVTSSGPSPGSDPSVSLHQVSQRPSSHPTTPRSSTPLSPSGPRTSTNSSPRPAETSASVSRASQGTSSLSFRTTGSNTVSTTKLLGPSLESNRSPPTPSVNSVTVTVPGNTTSYTFINLLPFHTYTLEVEACTRAGCSMSESHHTFRTPPAPPEGVPPPHLYSDTPTSVLLSWGAPERSNGPLEGWLIERRMAGAMEVFTVGRLSPSTPPLSFLDSSSALSPWTTYQYRLLASTQAGSTAGPWVSVTTKPSRPAGLSPPRVTVLGPDSIQVTWSPPLIANGEIQGYEVRLPEPRVSLQGTNASGAGLMGVNVTDLVPFTTYNVTVLACSHGGGQVGGCTESLPTVVTTLPSIPQGLRPLAVVAVSESLLAVSWEAPLRPNGPNIRYELLRRKSQQPLASGPATTTTTAIPTATAAPPRGPLSPPPPPPPRPGSPHSEDLHRWVRVYSGTKLFYQDKGLSRFTWYQYQLLVHNDVGYSAGEIVTMATMAGVPLRPPSLSVLPVNHTAVEVNWTQPSVQDLQGDVQRYFLFLDSDHISRTLTFPPEVMSTVIGDLWPSSTYHVSLWVSNGAHNTTNSTLAVTTNDGEPQGVSVPEVVVVNSTTVRVLWSPPRWPNGAIKSYSLYLNERLHGSTDNTSGSYLLGGLLPFTVYSVQVEVCTVYTCVKSNATQLTTEEDLPADLALPHTLVLSSRAVSLNWSSPGRPSGIMLGYEVLRRSLRSCGGRDPVRAATLAVAEAAEGSGGGGGPTCSYLECPASHGVCGTSCFPSDTQVCCDGVLYNRSFHHQCCEGRYLPSDNSSHYVCCGGKLLPPLPNHQCCAGYYIPMESGEHCCPDPSRGNVSVGPGDSCCGAIPFNQSGGQLCCAGVLHDGYRAQCCDGRLVDHAMVCCGDAESGTVHTHSPGMVCCGLEYINSSTSLCCLDHDGYPSMHPAGNATVTLQCCGSKVIHQEEECCNGIGYDPRRHVCADRPTPGLSSPPQCLQATLCPVSSASTAFCGSCDVDPSQSACTWVLSADAHANTSTTTSPPPPPPATTVHGARWTAIITHSPLWSERGVCASPEEVVYSGDANTYTYTDSGLEPFTSYEYRVRGWNSLGKVSSDVSKVTTHEDTPWGVSPPRWSGLDDRDDIIQLQWQAPARPNGIITHYVVLRDGQERYRGNEYSFTDVGGIGPFQEFTYQLRACNQAGCADSPQVVAVTVQGVPEGVRSPMVTALSPSSLLVTWPEPIGNNGMVQQYVLTETGTGTNYTLDAGTTNHTVTGLKPYTDYSFVLLACSAIGCGTSRSSTGRTLQDAPAGVWSRPRHLVLNSSAVELYWDQPDEPNGPPSQTHYRLIRNTRTTVFTGQRFNYTDTDLDAGHRYVYELEASTRGGSSVSGRHVVQTPVSCPTGIAPPYNVTVSGARSLFIAWTPPAQFNSSQPLQYNVLLNPGSVSSVTRWAGQNTHLTVTGLEPFTTYHVRIQACQAEGCGVGEGRYMQTLEAVPEGLSPPTVTASGAQVLDVHWTPPLKTNGLITSYFIHRRPVSTEEELLVFIWSGGPLEFVDASRALRPYSQYEYRVVAHNSKGSVYSQWALATTLEAEPEDMAPPVVTPTSAYSVHLRWTAPFHPNGLISQYRLVYKKHQQDPTMNSSAVTALTVEGSVLEANISGLQPYTEYSLRVEAVNTAGSVSSPWVVTRTLESSPAGLANFTVEQREQGRALLLTWEQPHMPNGLITVYNVYSEGNLEFSGLSRQFLFRRLEPWSVYSLLLEACTSAGCTRSAPQLASTAAAPPAVQPPPTPLSIGPDRVVLAWGPPSQPNGPIGEYSLLGRSLEEVGRGRSNENDLDKGKVLFRESSPEEDTDRFSYTVTGLRPWTQYQFSVRVHNPAGHTLSPWVTVTTKQAPPRGLAAPTVAHVQGHPGELLVSWTPPLESNGVLLSYRIQRDNVSFSFSFDPSVLSHTDEDLLPFTEYRYAVIACTSEGCVTSPQTNITTLEAPPVTVDPPTLNITAHSIRATWSVPLTENGDVTEYVLRLNEEEVYRGSNLSVTLSELLPHTQYEIVLLACNSGGCTPSATASTLTDEAPPTGLMAPTLKVTSSKSVEVSWTRPEKPNGVITGYELRRDGELIYVGTESHYHDFELWPNVGYSYVVRANNSRGAVDSPASTAKTSPSAPSGVTPPTLQAIAPDQVRVDWSAPARPNGDIISYTVYLRDPMELTTSSTVYSPQHSAFSGRHSTLQGLEPYHRYEVRVEACTDLGCSSSDWSSVLTLESPPAGVTLPLLDLQSDSQSGLQTTFLLSWSPPARPNGRDLHYQVYRRLDRTTDGRGEVPAAQRVACKNDSTSCRDERLQPYTAYQYQVVAVNGAGHSASPWVSGRTGPAPPTGIEPPSFLSIEATSAVVDILPPSQPNGIISLYRVFSEHGNTHSVLSEGTSREQTIHGLSPFTKYWVGVEACTCYQCCNQGPTREFRTLAAAPAKQHPPRPLTLSSRYVLLEWDDPQEPNGVIQSWELHVRPACPQPPQPISLPCTEGPTETRFIDKRGSYNVTGLQPYTNYELRVACFNNMGSAVSNWTTVTTLTEAPQYVSPVSVDGNVTMVWLDWSQSFSLNGALKEFSVTENRLRIYSGFYSHLHITRTSQKILSFQVTCTTDSGSATTPTFRYNPATGLGPVVPTEGVTGGVSMSPGPVYSELWFILLLALLGLLLLAILLGVILHRALRKSHYGREHPPLVTLHKTRHTGGEMYTRPCPELCSRHHSTSRLSSRYSTSTGFSDTKLVGGGSRFSPMTVLRVPSQSDVSHAYSQHALHRSVSQLIDRKSLMDEGSWDNPLGQDSGLYVEEDDEFTDAIKHFSSTKKEHTYFIDTQL